jgi:hypothetical protein
MVKGIRYACPVCEEVYRDQWDAKECCSYADEIEWCEECNCPQGRCVCAAWCALISRGLHNGNAQGLSLTYEHPFNGRFVLIDKLEDPGWVELGVSDAMKPSNVTGASGFRLAVHESQIVGKV